MLLGDLIARFDDPAIASETLLALDDDLDALRRRQERIAVLNFPGISEPAGTVHAIESGMVGVGRQCPPVDVDASRDALKGSSGLANRHALRNGLGRRHGQMVSREPGLMNS